MSSSVPENVLKKQKRDEDIRKQRIQNREKQLALRKQRRQQYMLNAQRFVKEYREEQKSYVDFKRQARAHKQIYAMPEAKVAFAIRIKGINKLAPQPRKILQLFRLRQLHNGAFIKLNKATIGMLKRVEPYITYGYLNRKTISDLIYKRGHIKIHGMRIPIQDNELIEKSLGEKSKIICVEDLINEIYTCGEHFKEANSLLWSFKLAPPRGGFNNKRHSFQQGGDWGNREDYMNKLVRRML